MGIKRQSRNEDEDDEERPRRRPKDDDDDEDDRPPQRRKSSDEEDDDNGKRPPKRRPAKAEVDDLEEVAHLDNLDELDEDEAYEEALREFNRKKALKIKQLNSLIDGLAMFEKHIRVLLWGTGLSAAASGAIFLCTFVADYFRYLYIVPGCANIALIILLPLLQLAAVTKCKGGPPKSDRAGMLSVVFAVSISAYSVVLFGPALWLSHVLEAIYLRNLARFLKDKQQALAARSVFLQMIFVGLGGLFVLAIACYFLTLMGALGTILSVILAVVYVLLVIKYLAETVAILGALCATAARAIRAEHTVEW